MRWLQRFRYLVALHFCFLVLVALNGCQGTSIASRRSQRPEAYQGLSSEWKALVDRGEICEGMDTNAVFIAWGEPSEVQSGAAAGSTWATWSYTRHGVKEQPYWEWEPSGRFGGGGMERRRDYVPVSYLGASVVFEEGRVVRWRRYAAPSS